MAAAVKTRSSSKVNDGNNDNMVIQSLPLLIETPISLPPLSNANVKITTVAYAATTSKILYAGTSTGSIYQYKPTTSSSYSFVKMFSPSNLPKKTNNNTSITRSSVTQLTLSPNEDILASGDSTGNVYGISNLLSSSSPHLVFTLECGNVNDVKKCCSITYLLWDKKTDSLFTSTSTGDVYVTAVAKKYAISSLFKSNSSPSYVSDLLLSERSSIVQLDVLQDLLLVTSQTRALLVPIIESSSSQVVTQVGNKARQGSYGGCFDYKSSSVRPCLYVIRPNKRLWVTRNIESSTSTSTTSIDATLKFSVKDKSAQFEYLLPTTSVSNHSLISWKKGKQTLYFINTESVSVHEHNIANGGKIKDIVLSHDSECHYYSIIVLSDSSSSNDSSSVVNISLIRCVSAEEFLESSTSLEECIDKVLQYGITSPKDLLQSYVDRASTELTESSEALRAHIKAIESASEEDESNYYYYPSSSSSNTTSNSSSIIPYLTHDDVIEIPSASNDTNFDNEDDIILSKVIMASTIDSYNPQVIRRIDKSGRQIVRDVVSWQKTYVINPTINAMTTYATTPSTTTTTTPIKVNDVIEEVFVVDDLLSIAMSVDITGGNSDVDVLIEAISKECAATAAISSSIEKEENDGESENSVESDIKNLFVNELSSSLEEESTMDLLSPSRNKPQTYPIRSYITLAETLKVAECHLVPLVVESSDYTVVIELSTLYQDRALDDIASEVLGLLGKNSTTPSPYVVKTIYLLCKAYVTLGNSMLHVVVDITRTFIRSTISSSSIDVSCMDEESLEYLKYIASLYVVLHTEAFDYFIKLDNKVVYLSWYKIRKRIQSTSESILEFLAHLGSSLVYDQVAMAVRALCCCLDEIPKDLRSVTDLVQDFPNTRPSVVKMLCENDLEMYNEYVTRIYEEYYGSIMCGKGEEERLLMYSWVECNCTLRTLRPPWILYYQNDTVIFELLRRHECYYEMISINLNSPPRVIDDILTLYKTEIAAKGKDYVELIFKLLCENQIVSTNKLFDVDDSHYQQQYKRQYFGASDTSNNNAAAADIVCREMVEIVDTTLWMTEKKERKKTTTLLPTYCTICDLLCEDSENNNTTTTHPECVSYNRQCY